VLECTKVVSVADGSGERSCEPCGVVTFLRFAGD
jgi:hypothetical protein